MTDLILVLVVAFLLLAAVPQALSYLVGLLARQRGSWWPVLAAVAIAPLVFLFLVRSFYAPGAEGWLQGSHLGEGRVIVHDVELGAAMHAGVALLVQVVGLFRSS